MYLLSVDSYRITNRCDLEMKKRNLGHAASFLFVVDVDVPRIKASASLKCAAFKKQNVTSPKENRKGGLYANKGKE